jgi:hypothetical protein
MKQFVTQHFSTAIFMHFYIIPYVLRSARAYYCKKNKYLSLIYKKLLRNFTWSIHKIYLLIRQISPRCSNASFRMINLFWLCKTQLYEKKKSLNNKALKLLDSRRYSNEDCCLLGRDSVQFGRHLRTFWTNLLIPCTELMGGGGDETKFVLQWVKRAKARLWKKTNIKSRK